MSVLMIWEEAPGKPTFARFDVVLSVLHEGITELTDHPVEVGVDITDHARSTPDALTIEGVVSNTPAPSNVDGRLGDRNVNKLVPRPPTEYMSEQQVELNIPPSNRTSLNVGNLTGQGADAVGKLFNDPISKARLVVADSFEDRIKQMYEELRSARRGVRLVRVETELENYDNMVFTSISVPRTAGDGSTATFTVALRKLEFGETETVAAPEPAEPIGVKKKSRGTQSAKPDGKDADKKKKVKKSFAASGFDSLSGALGL